MGYRLNRLDEPVFMAVPKPMLTEFGIHYRLESCGVNRYVNLVDDLKAVQGAVNYVGTSPINFDFSFSTSISYIRN